MKRRVFLKNSIAGAGALSLGALAPGCTEGDPPPSDGWDAGSVLHLLPTANHTRIRLKASFRERLEDPPLLAVGGRRVQGERTDSAGRFYHFDAANLEPGMSYTLQLLRSSGEPLCESWPLTTFPAPDASPERFRLLVFTCAGGPDNLYNFGFFNAFVPIAVRQRMLARALSLAPDAAVANGDHVYWDLQSKFGWALGRSWRAGWLAGYFDRAEPILGTPNESVLQQAFGPQIAGLYGVMLRSTPSFFLQDDHDYGENDEASEELRTFPADPFMLDLARTTQRLYYPELLGDASLPREWVRGDGVAESFGALRYGDLAEALLYDCRRGLTNALDPASSQQSSAFLPPSIEAWLKSRTITSPAAHLVHMPSTPVLWTAGKWGEWYPDFKGEDGALSVSEAKPYWPTGWGEQHDRLLAAFAQRRDRTPLFASGDLHAVGAGQIVANRGRALPDPVVSLLVGSLGTGHFGWPSQFRGQRPMPSETVEAEEWIAPIEENGFTLLDFEKQTLTASFYRWSPAQGAQAIDTLQPFKTKQFPRPKA